MRNQVWLAVVVTLAYTAVVSAESELARTWQVEWEARKPPAAQPWTNVELPEEIVDHLKSAYPGHTPVALEDYPTGMVDTFAEYLVWNVSADFDGNGKDDFALFMKDAEANAVLVAVHVLENGFEHHLVEDGFGQFPQAYVLGLSKPGPTRVSMADAAHPEFKDLTSPGITVVLMETCSNSLYYFEEGQYFGVYRGL